VQEVVRALKLNGQTHVTEAPGAGGRTETRGIGRVGDVYFTGLLLARRFAQLHQVHVVERRPQRCGCAQLIQLTVYICMI
jgi:hypothetical protein